VADAMRARLAGRHHTEMLELLREDWVGDTIPRIH
jgi:hypothetical protein